MRIRNLYNKDLDFGHHYRSLSKRCLKMSGRCECASGGLGIVNSQPSGRMTHSFEDHAATLKIVLTMRQISLVTHDFKALIDLALHCSNDIIDSHILPLLNRLCPCGFELCV